MLDHQSNRLVSLSPTARAVPPAGFRPRNVVSFEKRVEAPELTLVTGQFRPARQDSTPVPIFGADDSLQPRASLNPLIRVIDVVLAAGALFAFAPLMLAIALAIKLFDNGPVFFAHSRVGQNGRMFGCLKFRSMVVNADVRLKEHLAKNPAAAAEWALDHKLRNDPRITPLGKFLRKSSLDELPQLINVLRGEMSLVGPRPIVAAEVARYGRYISDYCSVRPGITGLWQVSGRNDVSYRRRVALDVTYSRMQSLKLYTWIIYRTVPALLFQRGSY